MATQALTSRIDTEILATAETILQTHGLTAHDYVRMAISRLVTVGGIPWDTVDQQLAANIKRQRRQQRKINALEEGESTKE